MKTKMIFAGFIALGIVVASLILVLGLRSESADAAKSYPEEAQSWIKSVTDTSLSWKKHDDAAADFKAKMEAEIVARETDATTAKGLRQSLCSKYHLTVDATGKATEVSVCPDFL